MKTIVPFVTALLLVVSALLVNSCGDSDKTTGTIGDNNDPQYLKVQEMVDSVMIPIASGFVTSGMAKEDGLDSSDFDSGDLLGKRVATQNDSASIVYHPLSGWWVAYLHLSESTADGDATLTLRDSLQYRDTQGRVQMIPGDSTDFFTDIVRLNPLEFSDSVTSISVFTRSAMTFADLQSSIVTVAGVFHLTLNGTGLTSIDTTGGLVNGRVAADYVIDEVTIPKPSEGETACPTSGVLTFTVTENLTTQIGGGAAEDIVWSVRITIVDESTYRVKVTLGAMQFEEYTILDPCERTLVLDKRSTKDLKHLARSL